MAGSQVLTVTRDNDDPRRLGRGRSHGYFHAKRATQEPRSRGMEREGTRGRAVAQEGRARTRQSDTKA